MLKNILDKKRKTDVFINYFSIYGEISIPLFYLANIKREKVSSDSTLVNKGGKYVYISSIYTATWPFFLLGRRGTTPGALN